ncbi:MAG: DNA-3-methyladenine glycosylase 2 family protein, partial [Lysobacterales bacterium]
MSRLRYNRRAAVEHLKTTCPHMAALIKEKGAFKLQVSKDADLFTSLAQAIAYQQLSGKAAATIHGRFEALFENNHPTAAATVDMPVATLRSVGLSNGKALSILDLAEHVVSGALPGPRKMAGMDDEEVTSSLCTVRGIGPWTAQMHLIFVLGRPDVMPATDLGIQKGVQAAYGLPALPTPEEVLDI